MPALGERFRAAREARGLSLSDVSEQIRIRSVYLGAIEDENWAAIGAPVYARGFLRTYARFLSLDPEEVVATFNAGPDAPPAPRRPDRAAEASAIPRPPQSASFTPEERPRSRGSVLLWVAGVVALLLVGFVVYNEVTWNRATGESTLAQATASPGAIAVSPDDVASVSPSPDSSLSPSPQASGLPADDGANSLALVLSATSWLRVTVDGSVSMEGTFPAGTSKTFHGRTALVRVGNAGGVAIYVDGKNVGKLGSSGDVVQRSFTL